jgi:hypothetical protein
MMFRISFLLALLAVGGVTAQDSSAPSVAPVVKDSSAPTVAPAPTCFGYCCQLAANIRALDAACADWGTAAACGECEIPLWCFFIPEGPRCDTPVCCAGGNAGDSNAGDNWWSCRDYCCEVAAETRAFDPTCADWGTGACGECKKPAWCDSIPEATRCNTAVCCSGAGNLSMNTAFAIIAGFVALFLKDFVF